MPNEFAKESLEETYDAAKYKRRIFKYMYVETINRQRDRYFCQLKDNSKIHQACDISKGQFVCRQLSCYFEMCMNENYDTCLN